MFQTIELAGLDIAIIGAYILYSIWSGLSGVKVASESLEEYYLAGRTLRGWQAGISMAATQFAADTPLVVMGLIATAGIFALWQAWVYSVAFLLMAIVLAPSWRRATVITDAQLTEFRYEGTAAAVLRGYKAIYFGFFFNCIVLGWVLLAAARITEPFLLWHEWLPAGLYDVIKSIIMALHVPLTASGEACDVNACAEGFECLAQRCIGDVQWTATTNNVLSLGAIITVTTLYSTTGGLRSVVKTDIAQFFIALAATAAFAWTVVDKVGGFSEMDRKLHALFPEDGSGPNGMSADQILAFTPDQAFEIGWAILLMYGIQWLCQLNADGTGYLAQRTMACRSDNDAVTAGIVFTVAQTFFRTLVWLPIGVGLLLIFPFSESTGGLLTAEREATFVLGMGELPAGVRGLMLTGMLGALASTLDTHLNWGSSYFTNDVYKRFICPHVLNKEPSPRSLVWVARGSNILILSVALMVMPLMTSIQTAWRASLLLGAGVGVLLLLRWFWWRMNAWGELGALIVSLVAAPLILLYMNEEHMGLVGLEGDAIRLLTMAVVATTAGIATTLMTKPVPDAHLQKFFDQVHPPGFWGKFAGEHDADNRKRLVLGLCATAGASLTVFTLLMGIGSWMMSSPPPAIVPHAGAWIALNLVVGVGAIPVWLKWLKTTRDLDVAPAAGAVATSDE